MAADGCADWIDSDPPLKMGKPFFYESGDRSGVFEARGMANIAFSAVCLPVLCVILHHFHNTLDDFLFPRIFSRGFSFPILSIFKSGQMFSIVPTIPAVLEILPP